MIQTGISANVVAKQLRLGATTDSWSRSHFRKGAMETEKYWEPTDTATQALVSPMLGYMGVTVDLGIREATRKWLIRQLEDDSQEIDMEDLEGMAWDFATGYEQALVDMGKREPDNLNTFRD